MVEISQLPLYFRLDPFTFDTCSSESASGWSFILQLFDVLHLFLEEKAR